MIVPIDLLPAVLVVEDGPYRMDAVDFITEAGFQTYEASSADQAIALMNKHADIGILFTDVEMPGSMDGRSSPPTFVTDGRQWSYLIVSGATHYQSCKHAH